MQHRSPARYLAPLALVAAVLAVFLVVKPSSDTDSGSSSASTGTQASETQARTTTTKKRKAPPRTYTVQAGDVLSVIAEKNGLTVARLQELNPDVDANALRTGQKLKLAPSS